MNKFNFIPNETHFQKIRFKTIGASDIPIILGLVKQWCTPYQLWLQKTGREKGFQGNIATKWGKRHEVNIIASYIEEKVNIEYATKFQIDYLKHLKKRTKKYKPPTYYYPFTEFIHPELPWAMAHPDCIDISEGINIEAKSGRQFASIRRGDMDGFDKDDLTESGIPLKYYVQCQWQMLCSGLKTTILRALIDTSDELTYTISYNKKIAEKLIEAASRFIYHVTNDKEPQPINSDDIKKLYPKTINKTSYLFGTDSEFAKKMVDRKKFLSSKKKKIETELTDINDSLFVYIGGNKYLYSEDNIKLCSQVLFEKKGIASLKEIEKYPEIVKMLEEKKLIVKNKVRYVR